MNKLQRDLQEWGKEVCKDCRELIEAGKTDKDFYVFQTALPKESPELLLIGINPGGAMTYTDRVAFKGRHRVTIEDLAQGNNIYKNKIDNNRQSSALERIGGVLWNIITEDKVIGINVSYFNTDKETDLSLEVVDFCSKRTSQLIKILQPKHIIFLTTNVNNLKRVGVMGIKSVGAYVKEAIWQDRRVLAIPNHGFYQAYSYENTKKISEILDEYLR